MKLSFEILVYQLSKIWEIHTSNQKSKLNILNPPLLYTKDELIKKNQIYLITEPELSNLPVFESCCLIFCHSKPFQSYKNIDCEYIHIISDISISIIWNKIQSIFSLYQEWIEQLQEISSHHGTLQEIFDVSAPLIECKLIITDETMHLLAASDKGQPISKEDLVFFTQEDSFQALMNASQIISDTFHTLDLQVMNITDKSNIIYIYNIFDGPLNLGAVSMHPSNDSLQEHHLQLFRILLPFIKEILLRPTISKEDIITNLFVSFINGNPTDSSKLHNFLNYQIGDSFRCIAIEFSEDIILKYGFYLKQRFQNENSSSIAMIHEGYLIGIINVSHKDWNKNQFYQSIHNWIGDIQFTVGLSNPFSNLEELPFYLIEATETIKLSNKHTQSISEFSDYTISYLLQKCTEDLPMIHFFPDGLLKVIQYNKISSVDYIETLRIWLEEGRNDARTATRLFISRNSFLNRRDRILSLLNNDINNEDYRFLLYLCIRLYETH